MTSLIQLSLGISRAPVDYLVPPPLPTPQHLTHYKAPNYAQTQPENRVIPLHDTSSAPEANVNESGFMTRIARWFGFGPDNSSRDQQLTSGTYLSPQYSKLHNEQPYNYAKPQDHQQNGKAPCNLCSKYPWVPMWPIRAQYQQQQLWGLAPQQQQQKRPQTPQTVQLYPTLSGAPPLANQQHQYQQLPIKQRAVQFSFPNSGQYSQVPFIPIPLPNLSASAIPPLYSAKPFRPPSTQSPQIFEQQLPSTETANFAENIGAHSELQPDRVIPTQRPSSTNKREPSFEIVRSHQLTDFVSSVEYPTTYVQSPTIDLSSDLHPSNHKPEFDSANTVNYQHEYFNPTPNNHVPASQILTELGSFGVAQKHQQAQLTTGQIYEQTTASFYTPQFEAQSLVRNSHQHEHESFYDAPGADNFPSASSHNLTQIQSNELYYTTTEPSTNFELSTQAPQQPKTEFVTEKLQETTIEFVPSLQTNIYYQQKNQNQQQQHHHQHKKSNDRETPKRLLDAPIYHAAGNRGSPRPFTRDPSELDLRLGAGSLTPPPPEQHPNHAHIDAQQHSTTPLLSPTSPPPHMVSSAASPTPTSTYSAIDASGQFAGMTPPAAPITHTTKDVHQIVIPYTTKNRPRPFEPTRTVEAAFEKWAHSNSAELHEQQESKLVHSATEVPPNTRRTTKYFTKILASNLRELLRREHEANNRTIKNTSSFDIAKLQKNIDDWTEQEYTSLSHRPSTPTIRGRSKHIPTEYLTTTTTPTPRQSKTTKGFDTSELPTSINNLEPLTLRSVPKGGFAYPPIVSNHLIDYHQSETDSSRRIATTSTSTTARTPSTTATPDATTQFIPYYIRAISNAEPAERWQKGKISISSQTKEKVYVVTPQPRFYPQHALATSTEAPATADASIFKSPRFLVRPTPGNGTTGSKDSSSTSPAPSLYAPELFGLMGLSAYVPAEPVEIIDGNSKDEVEDTAKFMNGIAMEIRQQPKSTMSPSPR